MQNASVSRQRLRDDLVSLAHRGPDVGEFSRGAVRILRRAVPFDGFCVLTFDPATLLPTGEVVENGLPPAATAQMARIEVAEQDYNQFRALRRTPQRAATLSEVTAGNLDLSVRHRELRRPNGFGDELRAALVGDSETWGALTLLRERGSTDFTPDDSRLVSVLSPVIAEGLRRAIVRGALPAGEARGPGSPGVVLLERDDSIALASAEAEDLLEELLEGAPDGVGVPRVVIAVASRARAAAAGTEALDARARVRTARGRWLSVHGSTVGSDGRCAVILEAASSSDLARLIAEAYGLTERERKVTQLVAQGQPTDAIAGQLYLSPWTVQDHLKSIFEKTGVGTRGELVARLFFEHYAPHLGGSAQTSAEGSDPPLSAG
jgi:DNA-binding CsgD family transcriptional regulator